MRKIKQLEKRIETLEFINRYGKDRVQANFKYIDSTKLTNIYSIEFISADNKLIKQNLELPYCCNIYMNGEFIEVYFNDILERVYMVGRWAGELLRVDVDLYLKAYPKRDISKSKKTTTKKTTKKTTTKNTSKKSKK